MARGKRAIALFEVIQTTKEKKAPAPNLATPSWWFKRRPQNAVSRTPELDQPIMRELPQVEREPEAIMPVEIIAPPPAVRPAPRVGILDEAVSEQHREIVEHEDFGAPPAPPAVRVGMDRDRQIFRLQVTYTSAMVTAFGLLVVVILAFVIGKAVSRGPASASAGPSIDSLRNGPSFPDVLKNVDSADRVSANISEPPTPRPVTSPSNATTQSKSSAADAAQSDGRRIVGLQYILVQSYPDEDDAKKACEALKKNGIACTVEKSVPGWGSSWFSVVSVTGFERTKNNPQYDQFVKAIRDVGVQFASSSKFKKFDPRPVGWREKGAGQ